MKLYETLRRRSAHPEITFADLVNQFTYGGLDYPLFQQTLTGDREEVSADFLGYVRGLYKSNGVVAACELVRMELFSEARFQFRRRVAGRPGELYGTTALLPLEQPWPNGTTGNLLKKMLQHADLAGNWFGALRPPAEGQRHQRIKTLRPDWVTIVLGSQGEPAEAVGDPDAEVLGYIYEIGGPGSGLEPIIYLREEVAHFAPIPDPEAQFRGMSWLTPVIREIIADKATTSHKLQFFERGGTPNMVVKLQQSDPKKFTEWVKKFAEKHEGIANAYRTIYLGAGADVTVVGADLKQLDFKATQGAGETRIAAAAGVPPVIVGLSEGLQAATYSNYGQARRRLADGTLRPLWREASGSLAPIIAVPAGSELWYDDRDIPFLQEDMKDAAEVRGADAQTLRTLIEAGMDPDSARDAVISGDFSRLKHTGLVSVQLQPPGTKPPPTDRSDDAGNGDET